MCQSTRDEDTLWKGKQTQSLPSREAGIDIGRYIRIGDGVQLAGREGERH